MKRKTVSGAAVGLLALCAVVVSILGFDLAMRRGSPTLDVWVQDAALENGRFTMTASQGGNSGESFRNFQYDVEDGALYVTLFSGLVYGKFHGDRLNVDIRDDGLNEVRQVYLRDGSAVKLIYSE